MLEATGKTNHQNKSKERNNDIHSNFKMAQGVRIKCLSSTKMSIFRKGESILHCVLGKSRLVALEKPGQSAGL